MRCKSFVRTGSQVHLRVLTGFALALFEKYMWLHPCTTCVPIFRCNCKIQDFVVVVSSSDISQYYSFTNWVVTVLNVSLDANE